MWDVREEIGEAFPDVKSLIGKCRFSDCRHESEPGCAVKAAIERGELSKERWDSFISLKKEAKYSDDRESFLLKKQQKNKEIPKHSRKIKNEKRRVYSDY